VRYAADFALVGIGAVPNIEIAREAGLACANGIVVDQFAVTSDSDILRRRLRLASRPRRNLAAAGKRAERHRSSQMRALAMIGKPKPYAEVPWFWSDQYDLKLQIAGLAHEGDEEVLRGDIAARKFALFYLRGGAVAAAVTVNQPANIW